VRIFLSCIAFLCCVVSFGQSKADTVKVKPLIIGAVHQLKSVILSETRTLNIYLPDGYNADDTTKYPVVYLLDGGTDEDLIHVTGLYQFNSFPWIDRVKPSIIVGIVNTNRLRDMTYPTTDTAAKRRYPQSGHSDNFIRFIEKELQPYIQHHFKTNASRTIIGESLGGLVATEILLKKPMLFDHYIIVSPSLWWDNGSLLDQASSIFTEGFHQPTSIYIGVGKEGLVPGKVPRVMEVDANVLADNIKQSKSKTLIVYFDYLPQEDHATVMYQALFNAIRYLYPVVKK
jgi:uncharacterized protein